MMTNKQFWLLADAAFGPIVGFIICSLIGLAFTLSCSKVEAVDPPTRIRNAGVAVDLLYAKVDLLEKEVENLKSPQIELDPIIKTIFFMTVCDKFGNKIYEGVGPELFNNESAIGKWDMYLAWKDDKGLKYYYGANNVCSFYTQQRVIKLDSDEIITPRKPLFPTMPPSNGFIKSTRD